MNTFKLSLFAFLKKYAVYFLSLAVVLIVIRVVEYAFYLPRHFDFSIDVFRGFTYSVEFDLIFAGCFFAVLLPVFYLAFLISGRFFGVLYFLIYGFVVVLSAVFFQFFHTLHILPGSVLFHFSVEESLEVAMTEWSNVVGKFGLSYAIIGIAAAIIPLSLHLLSKKSKAVEYVAAASVILSLGLWIGRGETHPDPEKFRSRAEYNLYSSKWTAFVKSTIEYIVNADEEKRDFMSAVKRFRERFGFEKTGDMSEVPFSRLSSHNHLPDWEEYLEFNDSMNIVIIFAEGLSASFTGSEAHYGSLTPHFDSLIERGLYWPNMLSITDRTHGIFSSALAGLPHGFERGFLNVDPPFPDHLSIPALASQRGYSTAFAYGGWSFYDNYRPFMEANGVEFCFDLDFLSETFDIQPQTINAGVHMWGFRDHRMADLYFRAMEHTDQPSPYLNILLTLSLHSPYDIPDEEYYFQKSMDHNPDFTKDFITANRKELACIAYSDEFFKHFFDNYAKRDDFKNTIFLIFGDHNIHTMQYKNELDQYHVPFLIYSEAVKKPGIFREIISHNDVPATVAGLLKKAGVDLLPKRVHWLGKGVRLSDEPKAESPIFLGSFTGELTGGLTGNKLLLYDKLYRIGEGMRISPLQNEEVRLNLTRLLRDYDMLNRYAVENNAILSPESRMYLYSE